MPRTLFLKIFVWFFLALIVVAGMTFVVGEIRRMHEPGPPMHGPVEIAIGAYAQTAAEIYEREGGGALAAYMDRMQNGSGLRAVLFGPQLQELSGRRMPSGAREVAARAFDTDKTEMAFGEPPPLMARPVTSARGDRYVLVAKLQPSMGPPPLAHHAMHLIAILLVGGLFCYWLARYLASPVTKLRAATRELARGNLSARVGPSLGRRRDELTALAEDFDLMAEKIESLINSQRRLLGDISHELRSPLARLNVALELARQRSGPDAISALERIQREAENLNEMIGQLLAITRLESGAQALRTAEVDLAPLVRQIADDADFEARSRNRTVQVKSCDPCTVCGSEELLRRAIENVIRNAVQYTAEKTAVEIEVHCTAGSKKGEAPHGTIMVRDHGPGVPESSLTEIFRPFYRVEDARDRASGGAGLGLAIADRSVRLHGGTVAATNAAGGGLLVTITLPLNP